MLLSGHFRCTSAGLLVLAMFAFPTLAMAREYGSPPAGGGLVKDPDGTWAFYSAGGSSPDRVYTATEYEAIGRLAAGVELDTGATGQTASAVGGITSAEVTHAAALTGEIRTGERYRTRGEAAVGDAIVAADEAAVTLLSKAELLASAGSAINGGGAYLIGVPFENGGELYALPAVPLKFGVIEVPVSSEDKGRIRNYREAFRYLPEMEVFPRERGVRSCEGLLPENGELRAAMKAFVEGSGFSLADDCEYAGHGLENWSLWEEEVCEKSECHWVSTQTGPAVHHSLDSQSGTPAFPCPGDWLPCWHGVESDGVEFMSFFIDDSEATLAGFPAKGINLLGTATESEAREERRPEGPFEPVGPAELKSWATPGLEFLLHGSLELLPGIEGPGVPNPFLTAGGSEQFGLDDEAEPDRRRCVTGKPVNCATGNEVESETDLLVGGRGPELKLTRTYNSLLASSQSTPGPFGYGWTGSYSAHLELVNGSKDAVVYQADGSTVEFEHSGEHWVATGSLVQATLAGEGTGYVYTLPDQTKLHFNSSGELTSEEDRNGNALTMAYNAKGQLESITDAAARKITLAYNSEGLVESATDPMKHVVKYTYEGKSLKSVTQPGESALRWQFKYNGLHDLTSLTDGRSNATTLEYSSANQVISETDPLKRVRKLAYAATTTGSETTITEPNGSTTVEDFNALGEPTSVTHASGTSIVTSKTYEYNSAGELIAFTDPNGHKTEYSYDTAGDLTSEKDANGNETKWKYDTAHDVETTTTPKGETTTVKRNSHGDPEAIERPAPGSTTQKTTYKYASNGDVESMTNPLEHTWKYEYDSYGDRKAETDPEGNKRTWEYNEDSQEIATVSPRGNVVGAKASEFTTTTERDALGRPLKVTEGLGEAAYSQQFGSTGSESEKLEKPNSDVVDASGDVWVSDPGGNRVEEFSSSGTFIKGFGGAGAGAGKFEEPLGLAINTSTKNVYVGDEDLNRISEFNEKGEFVRAFGWGVSNGEAKLQVCTATCKTGLSGSGSGEFDRPKGVAIDSSGNVWVADEENNRIDEFNEKGEFTAAFGFGVLNGESKLQTCTTTCKAGLFGTGNGEFGDAAYLAFSGGNLYVTDLEDDRVQEFNASREYVAKFGSKGTGNGQFSEPAGIAASGGGNLYVDDFGNDRVEEFTTSGAYVAQFGTKGTGSGQLKEPEGVAINSAGSVYVVDGGNNRIAEWITASPHVTKYTYDGNGNLESVTDPNSHTTKYTYDADNEQTKVEAPNKAVTETEYDSMGQVKSQTDGNKHVTKYVRNALEEVEEVEDPLKHKTLKEYDAAGNLIKLTDPAKRTTTYTYDPGNRLIEVVYSSGKPASIKYEYDKDGDRVKMEDGTGTSKYTYDQLDRMTEAETGHKETSKYEYDLANDQTKITYPNTKAVTRAFDKDGRLEKVTDWNSKETKFSYDPDSDLKATVFPSESKDEDTYAYNDADEMSEAKMDKGTEVLASLVYTRDNDGQVTGVTSKGLPGEEKPAYEYDANNRLTKGATVAYEYDAANNPTKIGTGTYKYNVGDELETGPSLAYTYDELGERTKTKPSTGPATTYGYDQAGELTSVERPKEGETPEIKDSYAYDGSGLRASQTISGTTTYMVWDMTEEVPLVLSDGTNSYIYGPGGLPIEQINNSTGTSTYLHHDQQGSTRLLTGSTGTVTGSTTFDAYGNKTGSTGTTTSLGYDAQYTSSDTGLIYMRARVYDPATGQFLSVDPLAAITGESYSYGGDNPVNESDRTGRAGETEICYFPGDCIPVGGGSGESNGAAVEALEGFGKDVVEGAKNDYGAAKEGIESIWNEVTGNGGSGGELPRVDGTGRAHGSIPTHPPDGMTEKELEEAKEELDGSIAQRKEEQLELGEDPAHRRRINEEERLRRQIEKKLGC
jgi:RHS repeat-associated protein